MPAAAAWAPEPSKQKGRPVAGRPLTNFINSNDDFPNTAAIRIQRLSTLCGVTGRRAELIADLVWGTAHG